MSEQQKKRFLFFELHDSRENGFYPEIISFLMQ